MARRQNKFWLDQRKHDERELQGLIEQFKTERTFASAIRDGLRLIADLREGRLDVLLSLFPWVADRLATAPIQSGGSSDNTDVLAKLERLENLIEQNGISPDAPIVAAPPLKRLQKAQATAPDDMPVLKVIKAKGDTGGGANLLQSLFGLQQ